MADFALPSSLGPRIGLNGSPIVEAEVAPAPTDSAPLITQIESKGWGVAATNPALRRELSTGDRVVHQVAAFGGGVIAGLAVQYASGDRSARLGNLGTNIKRWDADYSGFGTGTKTGAKHNAMHAIPGAIAFLAGKNRGEGFWGATGMACSTGVGIEVGQAFSSGKRPDVSDAARTCVYGAALGQSLWSTNQYAEGKYDETGNKAYKFLAGIANPERVVFGVGKDSVGKNKFTVEYNAPF